MLLCTWHIDHNNSYGCAVIINKMNIHHANTGINLSRSIQIFDSELSLPIIRQLALACFLEVVSSHVISPPPKRKALAIEMVKLKFLVDSSTSVISKDTAVKPVGRITSAAVSPIDVISWSPVGSFNRRRAAPLTSQVKRRGSVGFTPPVAHASFVKLATADASVSWL